MNKDKLLSFFIVFAMIVPLFSSCSTNNNKAKEPIFYRKIAIDFNEDTGWFFIFENQNIKEGKPKVEGNVTYSFYGYNLRYRYDKSYIYTQTQTTKSGSYSTTFVPSCLIYGQGSQAEKNDMEVVSKLLDPSKTVDEMLAIDPYSVNFENLDKEMFFRLMKEALTGEPNEEGTRQTYWDIPSFGFFVEPTYIDNYEFQVSYETSTGIPDEIYIDVLYKTGENYDSYIQLSDIIDEGKATEKQKELWKVIQKIRSDIKEQKLYIADKDEYNDKKFDEIELSRLYLILEDIHNCDYEKYLANDIILNETSTK